MAATKANSIVMTEGRPLPQIIRFSVPLALTGILQLLFNAADVIVVGKFDSSTALAAVGATTSLINLLIGAFIGIRLRRNIVAEEEQLPRDCSACIIFGAFFADITVICFCTAEATACHQTHLPSRCL